MSFSHHPAYSRSQEAEEMELPKEESWLPIGAPPADISIRVNGVTFHLNKKCMVSRSSKLAELLKSEKNINLSSTNLSIDTHVDPKIFKLAIKFCYDYEFHVNTETAIPLACLAASLGMIDDYRPDNLLNKILDFIGTRVLPDWNTTIKAFSTILPVRAKAEHLGLIDACLGSICEKAVGDQSLLGDPTMMRSDKSARRRLFVEELTSLPLPLYDLVVSALASSGVNQEHLADCVYRYGRRWVDRRFMDPTMEEIRMPIVDKINQKKVVEAVEKWMPEKRGAMPAKCLFQLLRASIVLQASMECQKGFESRIGRQLQEASLVDLCMPPFGYTKETKYDTKRVLRIFYHFSSDVLSELEAVVDVMEDFSAEAAMDESLGKEGMMEILVALDGKILEPMKRGHDGVYRAIDTYLGVHGFLTDAERMDICSILDIRRLSFEATEHVARNERLPPRLITQVVFLGQLRIRDAIGKLKVEAEEEEEVEEEEEEEVLVRKLEMVRIHGRVSELEKECERMKEEIEKSEESEKRKKNEKKRKGLWKEVKDVFGCKGNQFVDNNCHVKKKKKLFPKNGGGGSLCG